MEMNGRESVGLRVNGLVMSLEYYKTRDLERLLNRWNA